MGEAKLCEVGVLEPSILRLTSIGSIDQEVGMNIGM